MKRLISFFLAAIMILSLGITAMAAGSPTADQNGTSETATAPLPASGEKGLELYNADDELIRVVPYHEVKRTSVGNANRLSDEEKEAFLACYEDAKNVTDRLVKYFYWLDIPDEYKTEDVAYAKYYFTCTGQNVQLTVNGKEMEVEKADTGRFSYFAKLTEFGAIAILCDIPSK